MVEGVKGRIDLESVAAGKPRVTSIVKDLVDAIILLFIPKAVNGRQSNVSNLPCTEVLDVNQLAFIGWISETSNPLR